MEKVLTRARKETTFQRDPTAPETAIQDHPGRSLRAREGRTTFRSDRTAPGTVPARARADRDRDRQTLCLLSSTCRCYDVVLIRGDAAMLPMAAIRPIKF